MTDTDKLEPTQADNDVTVALTEWLINREVFFEDGPPKLEKIMHDFGAFADDLIARHRTTHSGEGRSYGAGDAMQSYLCPTPWCSREDAPHIWQGVNDKYYVTCPSCGVNGPDADDDTDAWDKWCWRGVDDKPKPVDPVKFVNDLLRAELLAAGATDYAKLVDEPKSLWWMPIVRKAMLATLTPQGDGEIERLREAAYAELRQFAQNIFNGLDTNMISMDTPADETLANVLQRGRAALADLANQEPKP